MQDRRTGWPSRGTKKKLVDTLENIAKEETDKVVNNFGRHNKRLVDRLESIVKEETDKVAV